MQQISYLLSHFDNFNQDVLNDRLKNSFFDASQFKEEVLKTRLIDTDYSWYEPIINAENQYYFQGQINFLIEFSMQDDKELRS